MAATLLLALFAALEVSGAAADAGLFGQKFTGDGTYYGWRTRGFGHCSFHFHGFGDSKGYVGTPLAINRAQYTGTSVCGMCVKFRGLGPGAGGNPIANAFSDGFVCDQCPECRSGDLDLQKGGDGRWKIEWYPVQCPVADSTFRFGFQGGNPWYKKVMVANARVPVASVQIWNSYNQKWQQLTQTIDNYFEYHGDANKDFAGCAQLQITSIFGDTVKDQLCCSSGTCSGRAQFPCRPDIGGGENCGAGAVAGVVAGAQAWALDVGLKLGKAKDFGVQLGSGALAGIGKALGRKTLPAGLDVRAARLPVDGGSGKPAAPIGEGQQCGGKKYSCGEVGKGQCKDAQWKGLACASGLQCVRNDASWWGCKKA